MKRYLLFAGYDYYPSGGWDDFEGDFDILEEASAEGGKWNESGYWWQVVDGTTGNIVAPYEKLKRELPASVEAKT